jgi:hypothetical protein
MNTGHINAIKFKEHKIVDTLIDKHWTNLVDDDYTSYIDFGTGFMKSMIYMSTGNELVYYFTVVDPASVTEKEVKHIIQLKKPLTRAQHDEIKNTGAQYESEQYYGYKILSKMSDIEIIHMILLFVFITIIAILVVNLLREKKSILGGNFIENLLQSL